MHLKINSKLNIKLFVIKKNSKFLKYKKKIN